MTGFRYYSFQPISYISYFQQWILCLIVIFLVACGVSVEVMANLVTTSGDRIVLAVCKVASDKFGNMKMTFDVTLVCLSIVLSFTILGGLHGVREGIIAAAMLAGQITKQTNKLTTKIDHAVLH